MTESRSATV